MAAALPISDNLSTLDKLDVEGQRVLVRADFDAPQGSDEALALQVDRLLPTVHHLLGKRARVVIAAHAIGADPAHPPSLEPAGALLAERLTCDVYLPEDAAGDMARKITSELRTGTVALLENLAREPGELQNDDSFARRLSALCDVFVNEAPSLFDRKLSSLIHLPRMVTAKALGIDSVRVAQGLGSLQRQSEQLIAVLALTQLDYDALATVQSWLQKVQTLILVGDVASSFAAAAKSVEAPPASLVSAEIWAHCRSLQVQAIAADKRLLSSTGGDLSQTLSALGPSAAKAPLVLVGPLDRSGIDLASLADLLQARSHVSAFGYPALLALYRLPSLLAHVAVSCPSEQVALRALGGEPLPGLAALTASV